jgi:HSP20 family protein
MFRPPRRVVIEVLEAGLPQIAEEVVQMIRWSPSAELANLHSQMDRLFEDFFGSTPTTGTVRRPTTPTYTLPLDVKETESGYQIQAPVPGFKPEEVEVTFSEGILSIRAQRTEETTQEQGGWLRKEVASGNYQRSLQMPGDIKADDITAEFENGILTVVVPKSPRPQPKKIQVASGSQKQLAGTSSKN